MPPPLGTCHHLPRLSHCRAKRAWALARHLRGGDEPRRVEQCHVGRTPPLHHHPDRLRGELAALGQPAILRLDVSPQLLRADRLLAWPVASGDCPSCVPVDMQVCPRTSGSTTD
eukprot:6205697-Pleurochrysis_carterae.AAC.2